jgi:hypothetical protein
MTFKELQKIIHYRQSESNSDQTRFFDRLKDKPIWIWNVEQHKAEDRRTLGCCCFNHIIGLPAKGGLERPLYLSMSKWITYTSVSHPTEPVNCTYSIK